MDVWKAVDAEREELVGLLETLDDEQWNTRTLCTEWRVRDLVAHLVVTTEASIGGFIAGMAKSGFNPNKFLANEAIARGQTEPRELLDQFKNIIGSRKKPPVVKPLDMLSDVLCHAQDVRRPLGQVRQVDEARLVAVGDNLYGKRFFGMNKVLKGLKLVADDVAWTKGDGPEVRGSGEALVMLVAGRRAVADDLSGEGKEILASRL